MRGFPLWKQMVQESAPFPIPDHAVQTLYHRAAASWLTGQTLHLGSPPFEVDLTKLFEQYRMLETLRGEQLDA